MLKDKYKIKKLEKIIAEQDDLLMRQNNMIIKLNEEVDHATRLIELYESCIDKGIKVEIHNHPEKGGNTDNTGTADFKFNNF